MYKYILFDLDGTLTDSKEGITKSVQYALKHFGINEPDINKLIPFVGPPLDASFMNFYGFDKNKAEEAILKYRERFSTVGLFENSVYPGMEDILKDLKSRNKILAVATSKPYIFTKQIVDKFQISKYFQVVVGSELDGTRGHKDEVIEEVLSQLNISHSERSQVLMIGDTKFDILGAKKCGIKSVGVRFGYSSPNDLEDAGADYICDTVDDLKKLLESM